MAERPRGRAAVRQFGEGLLRVAELAGISAAGCLVAAALLAAVSGRGFGAAAALICGLVGAGMMLGGVWQDMPMGPLARRRRRAVAEHRREDERDPAARARREVVERQPRSMVSSGGILSVAGVLVVIIGFVVDALVDRGG
jgi:uncharacterized membrane protein YebE (DUF533 family)